jgi:hypothetical protein
MHGRARLAGVQAELGDRVRKFRWATSAKSNPLSPSLARSKKSGVLAPGIGGPEPVSSHTAFSSPTTTDLMQLVRSQTCATSTRLVIQCVCVAVPCQAHAIDRASARSAAVRRQVPSSSETLKEAAPSRTSRSPPRCFADRDADSRAPKKEGYLRNFRAGFFPILSNGNGRSEPLGPIRAGLSAVHS